MQGADTVETKSLRDFLEIPYDELEEMNLEVKEQRLAAGAGGQAARGADAST